MLYFRIVTVGSKPANPFRPGFGVLPPYPAGRDKEVDEICAALAAGPGHPGFASLVLGARGTGKTTLLLLLTERLQASGWVVCKTDALVKGADLPIQETIIEEALDEMDRRAPPPGRRMNRLSFGPVGAGWDNPGPAPRRTRVMQRTLLSLVDMVVHDENGAGAGVVVIIDEFHNMAPKDASAVASMVQNARGRDKHLGFIGAGLPHLESKLLPHQGFTFFNRCHRHRMGRLTMPQTRQALHRPFADNGVEFGEPLLGRACTAANGHPFGIQSLGFHLWEATAGQSVPAAALSGAVAKMRQDLMDKVMAPIWDRLSSQKQLFLIAMSYDDGPSLIDDIAHRTSAKKSVINTQRRRLIDDGVIAAAGRGAVEFANDQIRELALDHQYGADLIGVPEPPSDGQPLPGIDWTARP